MSGGVSILGFEYADAGCEWIQLAPISGLVTSRLLGLVKMPHPLLVGATSIGEAAGFGDSGRLSAGRICLTVRIWTGNSVSYSNMRSHPRNYRIEDAWRTYLE